MSGSRARDDEIARLRDRIIELERQLPATRAPADGGPGGDLHAEIVRQQRQAEELGRIARLVNESLDLRTVSERLAEGVADAGHPGNRAQRGCDALADAAVPGRRGAGILDEAAGRSGAPGCHRRDLAGRRAPRSVLTS